MHESAEQPNTRRIVGCPGTGFVIRVIDRRVVLKFISYDVRATVYVGNSNRSGVLTRPIMPLLGEPTDGVRKT